LASCIVAVIWDARHFEYLLGITHCTAKIGMPIAMGLRQDKIEAAPVFLSCFTASYHLLLPEFLLGQPSVTAVPLANGNALAETKS
jgi:hypothetical protein